MTSLHTCKALPAVYTPNKIFENFPIKKIDDVFLIPKEIHTVGQLAKQIGNDAVAAYLEVIIFDFIKFVNPVRSMTALQIKQTAELIMEVHSVLKVPEVAYIFKLAKQSYFGAIYEGIDGMKIMGWFDKYFQDRLNSAELFSEKQHRQNKLEKSTIMLPKEVVKMAYEKMESEEFIPDPQPLKRCLTKEQEEDVAYQKFKSDYEKSQKKIK